MEPQPLQWYFTALVYLIGVFFYRFQKAVGWCAEQDIIATKNKLPHLTFHGGFAKYWEDYRFVIVYDFIAQVAIGMAWAGGLLTELLEVAGVSLPDKPSAGVWYPMVFFVAFAMSGFLSERLKNMMLRKMDPVAPGDPGK